MSWSNFNIQTNGIYNRGAEVRSSFFLKRKISKPFTKYELDGTYNYNSLNNFTPGLFFWLHIHLGICIILKYCRTMIIIIIIKKRNMKMTGRKKIAKLFYNLAILSIDGSRRRTSALPFTVTCSKSKSSVNPTFSIAKQYLENRA